MQKFGCKNLDAGVRCNIRIGIGKFGCKSLDARVGAK